MSDLPQVWELSALLQLQQRAEDAEELRTAILLEQASVGLADRLRGGTGRRIVVRAVDGSAVAGTLDLVASDALVLTEGRECHLVTLRNAAAVTVAEVPPALPARGLERMGCQALLRRLVDCTVIVTAVGGVEVAGPLTAVGADHIVVADRHGPSFIPAAALVRVRWRADGCAER